MADLAHLWLVAQREGNGERQGSRTAAAEVLVPREGQALALPMDARIPVQAKAPAWEEPSN